MRIRPGVELGNLTDVGCEREENQDYYCYAEPESEEAFLKKGRLMVIADGMGGHEGGQAASSIAVEQVRSSYLGAETDDPEMALADAIQAAHQAIQGFAKEHPEYSGMGTTCIAVVLKGRHLYYGHVGDSRLYLIRESEITQLTRDHTVPEGMVEKRLLQAHEIKGHPQRHVLTSALGTGESLQAEFPSEPIALLNGDILLLCTDGLHELVTEEEMIVSACRLDPGQACKELIEAAKARGGHDNITIQIVKLQAHGSAQKGSES
jgi:PPM family protein phosphatase